MPRDELTTIFMLDVVGSMPMWEENREAASLAIAQLERIVAECAASNEGKVHKSRGEGDSFFLTFGSPTSSILAAAELCRSICSVDWPTARPIQLRGAIRTGECELRDGDLFGPNVNRCARMRAVAAPNQVIVCSSTMSLSAGALPQDIHLIELGSYKLRDSPNSEELACISVDGLNLGTSRPSLGGNEQNNLPSRATGFIGREAELTQIESALRTSKLVTLLGPGGCGKTRLSEVVADRFVGEFENGVWFFALADCTNTDSIPARIAKVVPGLRLEEATWDALLSALKHKHLLLVLDNCEQLIPECVPLVRRLILECPRVRVLTTSRRLFNLTEEAVAPVPPFPVDEMDALEHNIESQPAFALFWSRARAKDPNLRLDATTTSSIVAICKRLSGIPLAIEQAASYAGRLSPAQIEERLRGKIGMLKAAPGTVEARHETMRATIEWSIDLLSDQARELVFQLACFSGGWILEAAEAISADDLDAFEAHDELVASSLVVWTDDETIGRRYRFLEPIREYVTEQGAVKDATHSRFLIWCLGFAERVDREMVGGNQAEWIRRAEFELENFRSALTRLWEQKDDRLPRLANHLKRLWLRTGSYREGATWIENALSIESSDEPELRATLLNALGACISRFGERDIAESRYKESLQIWTALGVRSQMASVLTNMAILAADRKDFQKARDLYAQGAALFEASSDDRGLGIALMNCSYMEILQGDWTAAKETTGRAIDLLRQSKDLQNLAFAMGNRAHALWELNETQAYATCAQEQLEVIEKLHDPYPLGLALASIAVNGIHSSQKDVARRALQVLDNLRGFEVSGLGNEMRRRLEEARAEIKVSPKDSEVEIDQEQSEFQDSYASAKGLLDEFIQATCHP